MPSISGCDDDNSPIRLICTINVYPAGLIASDANLVMLLPEDFGRRVVEFVSGKTTFPFVGKDELMCIVFLYGKEKKVPHDEIGDVAVLAERTASQLGLEIEKLLAAPSKLDTESIHSKIVSRQLQMAVDSTEPSLERAAADPAIIMGLFSGHVSYFNQDYYFELYGPLNEAELTSDIRPKLVGRMVMVGYNRKGPEEIGLEHPMIPVYMWFKAQTGAKP